MDTLGTSLIHNIERLLGISSEDQGVLSKKLEFAMALDDVLRETEGTESVS